MMSNQSLMGQSSQHGVNQHYNFFMRMPCGRVILQKRSALLCGSFDLRSDDHSLFCSFELSQILNYHNHPLNHVRYKVLISSYSFIRKRTPSILIHYVLCHSMVDCSYLHIKKATTKSKEPNETLTSIRCGFSQEMDLRLQPI